MFVGTRSQLINYAAAILTVTATVGGAATSATSAHPAAGRAASGQIPVFTRMQLPPNGSVELVFDSNTVQMVGLQVLASSGVTEVQLIKNDFVLKNADTETVNANVSFSAENVSGKITGTAHLSAGTTVTALGSPPQTITSGAFSITPEFGSSAPRPLLKVSPTRVKAGGAVHIHGAATSCPRGGRVDLISRVFSPRHRLDGLPVILVSVRHDAYSVRTTIPKGDAARIYTITARCGGHLLGSARLTVTAPRPPGVG